MPDNIGYQEITPQTVVPAGYTGIYDAEDLENIENDLAGNYIQMADIDLDIEAEPNDGIGISANLESWIIGESGLPYEIEIVNIAFGNNKFVATTSTNKIIVSADDGASWQHAEFIHLGDLVYLGSGAQPKQLVYGNGMWVLYTHSIVSGTSGNITFYTSADGFLWQQSSVIVNFYACDFAYGNGLFVVVGYDGKLYTSSDCTTWAPRASGFPTGRLSMSVDYDSYGGAWVISGAESRLGVSSDGITWTTIQLPGGADTFKAIACGNNIRIINHGTGTNRLLSIVDDNSILYTYDYKHFGLSSVTQLRFAGGYFILTTQWMGEFIYSSDGITWILGKFKESVHDMAYGNGKWIAVKEVKCPDGWENLGSFEGIYDGNGYKIEGLRGKEGLFVNVDETGIVRNTKIVDAQICAYGAISGHNLGEIENCYASGDCSLIGTSSGGNIKNCTTNVNVRFEFGKSFLNYGALMHNSFGSIVEKCCVHGNIVSTYKHISIGGLISNTDGQIRDCYSVCDIISEGDAGGLIEACYSNTPVKDCYVTGSIRCTGDSARAAGLIIGAYSDIENCYATGDVVCGGQFAGGLVCDLYGNVKNCYADNIVTCNNKCKGGGFVANNYAEIIEQCYSIGKTEGNKSVAGFVETSHGDIIRNCYSIGDVILHGTDDPDWHLAGGFIADGAGDWSNCYCVGKAMSPKGDKYFAGGFLAWLYDAWESSGGIITNCYFDATLSGMPDDGKGTPKTTEQMKRRETFVNWDFTNIWAIDPLLNYGYPYLQGSSPPPLPGIAFEIIFGPVTFGISHLEKRVRKVSLVVSKEPDAVMLVSTSASDVGDFAFEKEVAAGQGLDMRKIYLPMAQGNPSGGLAYRVRIRGIGRVQIHDISFDVSVRRAW